MAYSWDFDAEDGVFKNRELSSKVYENALENSVAMPYIDILDGFGKGKGDTMNVARFDHISEPASAELSELLPIPEVAFSIATTSITVKEYGVAVPYTGKLEALSKFNIENLVQRTLMEQKRLVFDSLGLTTLTGTNVKYVPTAATTGSITYNSTASGTALADLSYFHIEDIAQHMYDDLRIPYFQGESYVGLFRMKTLATLRRDSQFIAWQKYTNPQAKAKGETGTIERIKLVETNHAASGALPNTGSNNFGPGVVFGADAGQMIEAETPHLRAALPAGHGRFKSIAWYGLCGFGRVYTGATTQATSRGVSRAVHVTSA
jgi:N4-gp56 family major capsid protein